MAMSKGPVPTTIDQYIKAQPKELQAVLQQIRGIIRKAAPKAEECISYQMPAFKQEGMLVFFAAWKKHLGFYPTSTGTTAFADRLTDYEVSKGAIQFPYDKKLPVKLITDIVKFKVKENLMKKEMKKKPKA